MLTAFILVYVTGPLGLPKSAGLNAVLIGSVTSESRLIGSSVLSHVQGGQRLADPAGERDPLDRTMHLGGPFGVVVVRVVALGPAGAERDAGQPVSPS